MDLYSNLQNRLNAMKQGGTYKEYQYHNSNEQQIKH